MLALQVWFLAGAIGLPGNGAAAESAAARDAAPGGARAVFEAIETAWSEGNARALAQHLGNHPVSISLAESGPSGRFSRDQTYFILERLFAATQTNKFRFTGVRDPGKDGRVAVGLAERSARDRGEGRVVQDRVLVTLVPEGGRWVVSEIQALR